MAQIVTADDIKKLGTILSLWAHPDDESFCSAGLLATAVKNGQRVVCVTATKGEAGESHWPAERLGEIRAAELAATLKILGITEHLWLGVHDGECNKADKEKIVKRLAKLIADVQPDTILTFGPEGLTGNPDHQTVSVWASLVTKAVKSPAVIYHVVELAENDQALVEADKQLNIHYAIDKPVRLARERCDICFKLTPDLIALKRRALIAQPSQMEKLLNYFDKDLFTKVFGRETFVKAK